MRAHAGPAGMTRQERNDRILDQWAQNVRTVDIAAGLGIRTGTITNVVCAARAAGDKRAITRIVLAPQIQKFPAEVCELILNKWFDGVKTAEIRLMLQNAGHVGRVRDVERVIEMARTRGDPRAVRRKSNGYVIGPPTEPAQNASGYQPFRRLDLIPLPEPGRLLLCPEFGIEITYRDIISVDAMTHAGSERVRVRIALPRLRFLED